MMTSFFCLPMWACAFRRPLVQPAAVPMYSDNCIYLKMMPEVNLRLRPLNEQLIRFWRLEAPPS